jgi:hypothetical protein
MSIHQQIVNPAKALRTLRKTPALLEELLRGVSQADAARLRDGADGWSALFVVCHLRDFEAIFRQRVELMLAEEGPILFPAVSNAELEQNNHYAAQDLRSVLADLSAQRSAFITRLEGLSDEQWGRVGRHPEQGPGTILDVAINAGLHDVDHLEQLLGCLAPLRRAR